MKTIVIKKNELDEYEVPTPTTDCPDSVYFTDDREDAEDTATTHHTMISDEPEPEFEVLFEHGTYEASNWD